MTGLGLGLGFVVLEPVVSAASEPRMVAHGTDVVEAWRPDQRLYVKGNLGVGDTQLAGLEQWLDANATNWVVVLLESADGERYTDAAGQSFTGIEAVNHALGKGLMNRTAFGQSLDSRTQERNACFFALFLKDRRFSYFGSDAQDRRNLGEERWIGGLDAPAIRAMRDGGRVVDAVKDTINHIEAQLTVRITEERNAAARKAAEQAAARERAQANAQAELAGAREATRVLSERTTAFQDQHPAATGDLARPDLPALEAGVTLAEQAIAGGRFTEAIEAAGGVRRQVEPLLAALDRHANAPRQFEELAGRYQQQAQALHADAAAEPLREAADRLQAARQEHARGDSVYESHLAAAAGALTAAAAAAANAADLAEARRLLVVLAGSTAGILCLLLGIVLNRRRLKPMREARALYELWRQGLSEKTRGLFALLDRRATVLGSSTLDAEHRYSGQTLDLGRRAIKDVDELFIMSASVDRILGEAQALLEPPGLSGRVRNLFARGPFNRVLRLLKDEPVRFKPEEGLELIVRGPRTEHDALLGDVKTYEPFSLTFDELIAAFNERAARALEALDRIEASALECSKAIESAQRDCDQAGADAERLAEAAADGLPAIAPLQAQLLPAALSELAAGLRQAATDPVGALAGPAATAKRLSGDAAALATVALRAHRELLPAIREHLRALRDAGVAVGWSDLALAKLAAAADQTAQHALEASATEHLGRLAAAWEALQDRVSQAVALDERRRSEAEPAIRKARDRVEQARQQLGATLKLDPARTLVERDRNPDERLAKAREHLTAAGVALDRGEVQAALQALDAGIESIAEAERIAEMSLEVLGRRAAEVTALREETARLESLVPRHREVLEEILSRYAPTTWRLGAGDVAHPLANGTVADNLSETETSLATARSLVQKAEAIFATARVLEAASFWARAHAEHEVAAVRLREIEEKRQRLGEAEEANATQLARLEQRTLEVGRVVSAPATMRPTVALFENAREQFAGARAQAAAAPADPFALGAALETVASLLAAAEDKARCDRDVFEEASRSVQAAGAQLRQAQGKAAEVGRADFPASPAMAEASDAVARLAAPLQALARQLSQPNEDWAAVDAEADRIAASAATLAATLAGEYARGQTAVNAVSTAALAVRRAGHWTGRYGIAILGSPGSQVLAQARQALEQGAYEQARSEAETARRMADAAVAEAEAAVMRRRAALLAERERERQRRLAAEQARQARRSSDWGTGGLGGILGGGSHGGFGGGSSWGASGSGAHTSGFGSGSGARTSGW